MSTSATGFADPRTWERLFERMAAHFSREWAHDAAGLFESAVHEELASFLADLQKRLTTQTTELSGAVADTTASLRREIELADRLLAQLHDEQVAVQAALDSIHPSVQRAVAAAVREIDAQLTLRADTVAHVVSRESSIIGGRLIRDAVTRFQAEALQMRRAVDDQTAQATSIQSRAEALLHEVSGRLLFPAPAGLRAGLHSLASDASAVGDGLRQTSQRLAALEGDLATLLVSLNLADDGQPSDIESQPDAGADPA